MLSVLSLTLVLESRFDSSYLIQYAIMFGKGRLESVAMNAGSDKVTVAAFMAECESGSPNG